MCKNPLDSVEFVLNKKWIIKRGPNIDLKTLGDKWKDVAEPEKDVVVLAESGLLESHAREGTQRFPTVNSAPAVSLSMKRLTMKTFTMYRRGDISATHDENQANKPDEPQFEGVVFSDGRVIVRWLTAKRSISVWDSMDDMLAIHGHPEYQSELVWND